MSLRCGPKGRGPRTEYGYSGQVCVKERVKKELEVESRRER